MIYRHISFWADGIEATPWPCRCVRWLGPAFLQHYEQLDSSSCRCFHQSCSPSPPRHFGRKVSGSPESARPRNGYHYLQHLASTCTPFEMEDDPSLIRYRHPASFSRKKAPASHNRPIAGSLSNAQFILRIEAICLLSSSFN
jgi:hypothetical protein